MTSSALPTARPSGASIAVSTARVRRPARVPMATIASASVRASGSDFRNAPAPTFTSSTSASVPSAIFLLMIDEAMSGRLSTVPVTSRSAYSFLSAGASVFDCPTKAQPIALTCARNSSDVRVTRNPGIDSSLSIVPPVWPSARPELLGTSAPQEATSGTTTSDVLSPTPPVLCFPTFTPRRAVRSARSPDRTIASVSQSVSSSSRPRKTMAISSAEAW